MLRHVLGVSPSKKNFSEAKNWLKVHYYAGVRRVGFPIPSEIVHASSPKDFFQRLAVYAKDLGMHVVRLGSERMASDEAALVAARLVASRKGFLSMSEEDLRAYYAKAASLAPEVFSSGSKAEGLHSFLKAVNDLKSGVNIHAKAYALSLYHSFYMYNAVKLGEVEALLATPLKTQHLRGVFGKGVKYDFIADDRELQLATHSDLAARENYSLYRDAFVKLYSKRDSSDSFDVTPAKGFIGRLKSLLSVFSIKKG